MKSTYRKLSAFLTTNQPDGSLLAAVQRFLIEKELEVSQATLVHLYRTLSDYGEALGNPSLDDLNPRMVATYADNLKTGYSPGTIRPIIGDLKQFHRWLYERRLAAEDLAARLKKPRPVKEKHHAEEADMQALIKHLADRLKDRRLIYRDLFGVLNAENSGWIYEDLKVLHDLTAMMFLYETGCRAGELCNLSSHQMNKAIHTPATVYTITCYGKTNNRTYRFTEATAELYRLWNKVRPHSLTWVFCSWRRGGKPDKLSTPSLGQMLSRRCRQAGVRAFRPHSMRHAKVIRSRRLAGLEMASRLVDHSSITTTRDYDYIDDDELSSAAKLTGYRGNLW